MQVSAQISHCSYILMILDRGLENLESICTRAEKPLFGGLPVDDIPDVLHIRSFTVQVLLQSVQSTNRMIIKLTCR
jgi:hypothetical protein